MKKIKEKIGKFLHRKANRLLPDNLYHYSLLPSAPYDYVQTCVVRETKRFIPSITENKPVNVIIVGAYEAYEVEHFEKFNPELNFIFHLYEANPQTFEKLKTKFAEKNNIFLHNYAVDKVIGKTKFYENSIIGTGSLLELSMNKFANTVDIETIKEFEVETITLDAHYQDIDIDILWIDVQGAEKQVLDGAENLLKRVNSIFIEVQHDKSYYKSGVLIDEIDDLLKTNGFKMYLLGIDPVSKQGNALYVR